MDLTGLVHRVSSATLAIDSGRKGFAVRGKADAGRILYETGISEALSAFRDAQSTIDPYIIILIEYTFLNLEFQFCAKDDTDSLSSLTQAIQSFDDAFLAIKIVEDNILYQGVEQTYPHNDKYRVKNFLKDAYHIAMIAHKTRLRNMLRTPGVDPIEKALLKQRFANLATGQNGYMKKQEKVLNKAH